MEQNLVKFANSMYPHVGPYTPYFCFGNGGIRSVPTLWPLMFDPLVNPTTPPKLILGITQVGIVIDQGEPSNEDDEYFKRKHNPRMPRIIPIKKLYHEQRGQPSPIGNASWLPTIKWNVPTNTSGGEPFNGGGDPLGGGGSSFLGGGNKGPPRSGGSRPLED